MLISNSLAVRERLLEDIYVVVCFVIFSILMLSKTKDECVDMEILYTIRTTKDMQHCEDLRLSKITALH